MTREKEMSYNGRESGSINGREPPLGQYVETADYVIFKEDGVIKAKNGEDGSIEFSDSEASNVFQSAFNNGKIVYVKGGGTEEEAYILNSGITMPLGGRGTGNSILTWTQTQR